MNDHYVELTQYLRPDGNTKTVLAPVSEAHKKWCGEHQPVLSAEILPDNEVVVLYGRRKEWCEENELVRLAHNGPGDHSPTKSLAKLIDQLMES
jgi:hypothetical protein